MLDLLRGDIAPPTFLKIGGKVALNTLIRYSGVPINPIPTEGGPFGPKQPKIVWHFHSFMTGVTEIHGFVCFSICLVPLKLFWEKKFWNFEKLKKNFYCFDTKGSPLCKKNQRKKIFVSFPKSDTISTWIWILHVFSFLLRYITSL